MEVGQGPNRGCSTKEKEYARISSGDDDINVVAILSELLWYGIFVYILCMVKWYVVFGGGNGGGGFEISNGKMLKGDLTKNI
jgi:hypothetical protein